jgi:hypothetical protein
VGVNLIVLRPKLKIDLPAFNIIYTVLHASLSGFSGFFTRGFVPCGGIQRRSTNAAGPPPGEA